MQSCEELAMQTNQRLENLLSDLKRITLNAVIVAESMPQHGIVIRAIAKRLTQQIEKIEKEIQTLFFEFKSGNLEAAEQMLTKLEEINIWLTDVSVNFAVVAKQTNAEADRVMKIAKQLEDLIKNAKKEIANVRGKIQELEDCMK